MPSSRERREPSGVAVSEPRHRTAFGAPLRSWGHGVNSTGRAAAIATVAAVLLVGQPFPSVLGSVAQAVTLSGGWAYSPDARGADHNGAHFWVVSAAFPFGSNWSLRGQVMRGHYNSYLGSTAHDTFTPIAVGPRLYMPAARLRPYLEALPAIVISRWADGSTKLRAGAQVGAGLSVRASRLAGLELGVSYMRSDGWASGTSFDASGIELGEYSKGLNQVILHLTTSFDLDR